LLISNDQNLTFNTVIFEGKLMSEWVDYFRLNLSEMESGNVIPAFLSKTAEASYLMSKIKPFAELELSKLKREHDSKKISIIESYSSGDKTRRAPSLEVLDSMAKNLLKEKYDRYDIIQMIATTFEVIISQYDKMSYMINKVY